MNQIRDADDLLPRIKVGIPKPTPGIGYGNVAQMRQNIKKPLLRTAEVNYQMKRKLWPNSLVGLAPYLGLFLIWLESSSWLIYIWATGIRANYTFGLI